MRAEAEERGKVKMWISFGKISVSGTEMAGLGRDVRLKAEHDNREVKAEHDRRDPRTAVEKAALTAGFSRKSNEACRVDCRIKPDNDRRLSRN